MAAGCFKQTAIKTSTCHQQKVCLQKQRAGKGGPRLPCAFAIGYSTEGQDVENSDVVILPQLLQQIAVESSGASKSQAQPASCASNGRDKKT